jgi:thiamine pyrophosphokinase
VRIETSSPQKDETDLELALLNLADEKVKRIVVLGALGGRLDMTISNVLLLTHPRLASLQIELWQGRQTAWLIRPPGGEIRGREGDTLSLIPLDGDAQGITTYDLAYPLQHDTLSYGPARGVSNILSGPVARVEVHSGTLLAIHIAEAI